MPALNQDGPRYGGRPHVGPGEGGDLRAAQAGLEGEPDQGGVFRAPPGRHFRRLHPAATSARLTRDGLHPDDLVELLPVDDCIVSIEDTLELRIDRKNCVRFEARGIDGDSVTIRVLVRHALRHRLDHIVVGEVRGGEAADLLKALNTGHGGSLTTIPANNAESALSRLATCAMQGETELPWEVTCRGVVDGISMVIHMTRREGTRYVEEALHVGHYDAEKQRWHYRPVAFSDPRLELDQVR